MVQPLYNVPYRIPRQFSISNLVRAQCVHHYTIQNPFPNNGMFLKHIMASIGGTTNTVLEVGSLPQKVPGLNRIRNVVLGQCLAPYAIQGL